MARTRVETSTSVPIQDSQPATRAVSAGPDSAIRYALEQAKSAKQIGPDDIIREQRSAQPTTGNEVLQSEGAPDGAYPADQSYANPGTMPPGSTGAALAARIPQREPWLQHENLNPLMYTPEMTRAGMQQVDSIDESDFDTFENITQNQSNRLGGQSSMGAGGPLSSYTSNGGLQDSNSGFDPGSVEEDPETEVPFADGTDTDRAKKAFNFFKGIGFTDAQASGIIGNLQAESGIGINHNAKGDGGDAWGIAQWNQRYSRDRAITNFQKVIGRPLRGSSFDEQLKFIKWELENEGGGKKANRLIRALKDPANGDANVKYAIAAQSAAIFDQYFERSDGSHRSKRKQLAVSFLRQVLNGFNVKEGSPSTVTIPSSTTGQASGGSSTSTGGGGSSQSTVPSMPGGFDPGSGGAPDVVTEPYAGSKAKIRNKPIQKSLKNILNRAAKDAGVSEVRIISGGQDVKGRGGRRTGSTRHDAGYAADLDIYVGGQLQRSGNSAGKAKIAEFITYAVYHGILGVGHAPGYMGDQRMHLDVKGNWNGGILVWGAGGKSANRLRWVEQAARRGKSR